jgi:hypothetical protein
MISYSVSYFNKDRVVGIATGYVLDCLKVGVRVQVVKEFPLNVVQTRFRGPSNEYRALFS